MANASGSNATLRNETEINVAALLQEPVGSSRTYALTLDAFPLAEDGTTAEEVRGKVRVTRLPNEILADVSAAGTVELECVRCLRDYAQPFETSFAAEYRPTIDIRTGHDLEAAEDDERFTIDDSHRLDIGEVLRQEILVALPMRAICGPDCPGPDVEATADDAPVDDRFAALSRLLDDASGR